MESLFDALMAPPEEDLLVTRAKQQFPILNSLDVHYKMQPGGGPGYMESWPPGEPGAGDQLRPSDIPMEKFGVSIYDKTTRPIDVMGDIASHMLIHTDPRMQSYYGQFKSSLTEKQHARLRDQYEYATKNEGESRDFSQWAESSGIPAYFRGYPFQQWPEHADNGEPLYEPHQKRLLDSMMNYLKGGK